MKHLAPVKSDLLTIPPALQQALRYLILVSKPSDGQKFLLPSLQCSNCLWDTQKKPKLTPQKPISYTSLISDCVTETKSNTSGGGGPLCTQYLKFCISCDKQLWEQSWSATTACRCAAYVMYLQCNLWVVTEKKKLLFPLPVHALIYKKYPTSYFWVGQIHSLISLHNRKLQYYTGERNIALQIWPGYKVTSRTRDD